MKNQAEITEKTEILAKHLDCEMSDIKQTEEHSFEIGDKEYLVCTDEEANLLAANYIKETIWAFRPSFLIDFIPSTSPLSTHETNQLEEVIEEMQSKMCESCNPILTALIGGQMERLINCAIENDGVALFLANYDHKEIEEGNYFIYRKN